MERVAVLNIPNRYDLQGSIQHRPLLCKSINPRCCCKIYSRATWDMHKSISLSGLLFASLLVARRRSLKLIFTSSPKEPSLHIQEVQLSMRPWSCANFRIFFPMPRMHWTAHSIPLLYTSSFKQSRMYQALGDIRPDFSPSWRFGHMESLTGVVRCCTTILGMYMKMVASTVGGIYSEDIKMELRSRHLERCTGDWCHINIIA